MNEINLREKLNTIIRAEYDLFIQELKKKDADEIINRAYEITIKSDILCILENIHLNNWQIELLLNNNEPIGYIYTEWLRNDYSHIDMLKENIEELIGEGYEKNI